MNMTGHSRIAAIGTYLPEKVVSSSELMDEIDSEQRFGIPNTFIEDLTGIHSRRIPADGEKPSDLAIMAGRHDCGYYLQPFGDSGRRAEQLLDYSHSR
jgi:3-oxoacyl-[acyl-carrier-protein] synthase III